jgi:hypothetical protein
MARQKATTSLAPVESAEDKLARFRISDETVSVKYNGSIWRVKKRVTSRSKRVLLGISRGNGEREEFLWVAEECCAVIPPKKKREPKAKPAPKRTKAAKKAAPVQKAPAKAKRANPSPYAPPKPTAAKKAATPKKVAKKTTKRGSVRSKKK